jgi:putative ABC transport system ATP-binding protein
MLKLVGISKIHQAGEIQTTAHWTASTSKSKLANTSLSPAPPDAANRPCWAILGLLDVPNHGEYWFEGQNVAGWSEAKLNKLRRGRIGFIFQSFNLIEELTVFENVELALEYNGTPARERRQRVTAMLDKLGVGHRAAHRPSQLSGGQQQRVAIARALVAGPAVLLADEPTGNLDSAHGDEVMRLLRDINAEGTTVVMVTHSPSITRRKLRAR